tara:strand:- start:522 stop:695 length:174 start_codon:yes stop_codon:yes gene_type:complete
MLLVGDAQRCSVPAGGPTRFVTNSHKQRRAQLATQGRPRDEDRRHLAADSTRLCMFM